MFDFEFLNQIAPEIRDILLRIALAILALLLIWLLRRLISALLLIPLRRLLIRRTSQRHEEIASRILEIPIRFLIIALGIYIARSILAADPATTLFFARLSRTFVILAAFITVYNAVDLIIASSLRLQVITGISLDEQLIPFMRVALKVIIVAIALIVVLQEWEYDVNGLVAGLGLSGLAFSLAAKDTAANLFAFTTIVSDKPFLVGDFIKTKDVEGTVEDVGMRNVRVRQMDQAYVTVPNAVITAAPILNWSRLSKRHINFTLGLTYDASSRQIRTLLDQLRQMLASREKVDPESVIVNFTDFGENSLNILIRCYVLEPNWGLFTQEKEEINLEIMDIVENLGMSIAFPSRTLYIENFPPMLDGQQQSPQLQQPASPIDDEAKG